MSKCFAGMRYLYSRFLKKMTTINISIFQRSDPMQSIHDTN